VDGRFDPRHQIDQGLARLDGGRHQRPRRPGDVVEEGVDGQVRAAHLVRVEEGSAAEEVDQVVETLAELLAEPLLEIQSRGLLSARETRARARTRSRRIPVR